MEELILQMKEAVFAYKSEEVLDILQKIFQKAGNSIMYLKQEELADFLQINQLIQRSMEEGDYLLLLDLIEFELVPMVGTVEN